MSKLAEQCPYCKSWTRIKAMPKVRRCRWCGELHKTETAKRFNEELKKEEK